MRSVVAECVLEARCVELLGDKASLIDASSAGLEAEHASPAHPKAQAALELLGLPPSEGSSSLVSEELMTGTDLAVTMTRQQCYQLASRFPDHGRKCFSLIELNGALETILEWKGTSTGGRDRATELRATDGVELEARLALAVGALKSAPRELLRPLPGVDLDVRRLMTQFATCFYHVSGVQDPVSGTRQDMVRCAHLIDSEVTAMLEGLLALALTLTDTA
ncbi:MAG: hypothetical protein KKF41_09400 [Actinobacteria bacterium]|nr:hypothetical protein [Actinomycetota bacterium]MBU2687788.1 hypothetical protein [Actinomycetota bacterium]